MGLTGRRRAIRNRSLQRIHSLSNDDFEAAALAPVREYQRPSLDEYEHGGQRWGEFVDRIDQRIDGCCSAWVRVRRLPALFRQPPGCSAAV
jgi:hypothetical protein